jgi:hypothetical protein
MEKNKNIIYLVLKLFTIQTDIYVIIIYMEYQLLITIYTQKILKNMKVTTKKIVYLK